jgi:hypothetical protein
MRVGGAGRAAAHCIGGNERVVHDHERQHGDRKADERIDQRRSA